MPLIPFGEFLPDLPLIGNPGATVATNVLPGLNSYRPLRGLTVQSGTLDAYARGAVSARDKTGATFNYAGDATKLYKVTTATATDASGSVHALSAGERWEFAKFGEVLVAVAISEAPQALTLGAANFANLGGTPPKARHICTIGKQDAFLVLANVDDSVDGLVPNRVQWSAAGDETGWTSGTGLAGQQDLQGQGGWNQRVCGGEFGVIWQERALWRMDFVGAPDVFALSEVEDGQGTPSPGSVVQKGNLFYYLGQDGFYVFDGARSTPIGNNKVDTTFYSEVDQNFMDRITGIVDPAQSIVIWSYPTGNSKGNGDPDKIILYDYVNDRWSQGEVDHQMIFVALSDSVTVEGLDSFSTNLDTLSPSLDSRQWVGNSTLWGAFDRSNKLSFFNGSPLNATIETGEFRGSANGLSLVDGPEPLVEGADLSSVTVQVGSKLNTTDTISFEGETAINSRTGQADVRLNDKYHKIRVKIASDENWTHATGVNVNPKPTGRV